MLHLVGADPKCDRALPVSQRFPAAAGGPLDMRTGGLGTCGEVTFSPYSHAVPIRWACGLCAIAWKTMQTGSLYGVKDAQARQSVDIRGVGALVPDSQLRCRPHPRAGLRWRVYEFQHSTNCGGVAEVCQVLRRELEVSVRANPPGDHVS